MAMKALRDGASNGILKYFLLGLLVLAGGGLVFTDVGGFFRGGVSTGDVVKIGNATISAQQFDRNLRANLRSSQMTPAQAYQFGYVNQMIQSEIRAALALQAAQDYGLRIGREQLAKQVQKTIQPLAQDGQNARDILTQILASRGISEGQFLQGLQSEIATTAVSQTLEGGFAGASDAMVEQLARLDNETRHIEYIHFKDADFKAPAPPSEEILRGLYEAQKDTLFAIPEQREGQLIIVKMDALKETIHISDEELRAEYDANIDSYSFEETRTIEQALLSNEAEAQQVAEKTKAGQSLKNALKAVVQNTTDFIPAKAFEKTDLPEDLREPVFKAGKNDIIGPIETGLGYQVLKLTKISAPRVDSFESVSKILKEDLLATRLIDAQYELANAADDLLASGMSAEEIAQEIDVEIIDLPSIDQRGFNAQQQQPLNAEYAEDAQTLVENLFLLGDGESSPVFEMTDGRMAAIMLKSVIEQSAKPFEEVKSALEQKFIADNRRADNRARVSELRSAVVLGEKTLNNIEGRLQKTTLTRIQDPAAPFTPVSKDNIFNAPLNDTVVVPLDDGAALVNIVKIDIPQTISEADRNRVKDRLAAELRSEAITLFIQARNNKTPARVNERLLQQMYGQQDTF